MYELVKMKLLCLKFCKIGNFFYMVNRGDENVIKGCINVY